MKPAKPQRLTAFAVPNETLPLMCCVLFAILIPVVSLLVAQPAIPLFGATVAVVAIATFRGSEPLRPHLVRVTWLPVAILAITALILPFALNPERHLERAVKIAIYAPLVPLGFLLVQSLATRFDAQARRLLWTIVIAILVGQALAFWDLATRLSLSAPFHDLRNNWSGGDLNDSTVMATILLAVFARYLRDAGRYLLLVPFAVFLFAAFEFSYSETAKLVGAVLLVGVLAPATWTVVGARLALLGYLALFVAIPLVMTSLFDLEPFKDWLTTQNPSISARMLMWTAVSQFVMSEGPQVLLGNGFRSMGDMIMPAPSDMGGPLDWQRHPHNAPLQLILDLGLWGVAGTALVAHRFNIWLGNDTPERAAAGSLALVGAMIVTVIANDFWHDWWWSFLVILGCFLGLVLGVARQR